MRSPEGKKKNREINLNAGRVVDRHDRHTPGPVVGHAPLAGANARILTSVQ